MVKWQITQCGCYIPPPFYGIFTLSLSLLSILFFLATNENVLFFKFQEKKKCIIKGFIISPKRKQKALKTMSTSFLERSKEEKKKMRFVYVSTLANAIFVRLFNRLVPITLELLLLKEFGSSKDCCPKKCKYSKRICLISSFFDP